MNLTYNTIHELPMWNFFMINKTEDYKYLFKVYDPNEKVTQKLVLLWQKINTELFDELGVSNEMQDHFRAIRRLNIAKIDALIHGGAYLTLYELEQKQFERMKSNNSASEESFYKSKIGVEKVVGTFLDLKKISVYEYYQYVEVAKEISKSNGKDKE